MVSIGVAVALAIAPQALARTQAKAEDGAATSWDEATTNRAKMKTSPSFVAGPHATLPESEKALGHHGKVVIEGVLETDGRMRAASVKTSSGVPALDAIALQAAEASQFAPAKDAAGAALPVVVSMPFDLVAYKSATGGAWEYRCSQFVRDMDWWRSANPQKPYSEHELYKMYLGFSMMSLISAAHGDRDLLRRGIAAWDRKWEASIETCRKRPKMLQKDLIFG